jgi:polyisoprenoid-binding protein YceI
MNIYNPAPVEAGAIEQTAWRIDPARSSVEFEVPTFWGMMSVKGGFGRYEGTLDLRRTPAVELKIDAASIDTRNARRDKHLRSDDFFGVEAHPHVRFTSESATLDGDRLAIAGNLEAGGGSVPLRLVATLRHAGSELEMDGTTEVDQRMLGMTFTLMGTIATPARLAVRGRLISDS